MRTDGIAILHFVGRLILRVATFSVVFLVAFLAVGILLESLDWSPPLIASSKIPLFVFGVIFLSAALAGLAVALSNHYLIRLFPRGRLNSASTRPILGFFLAGYLLTALFGSPAVISESHAQAVEGYKRGCDRRLV